MAVTPLPRFRNVGYINVFGYVAAALIALVLLPLWPFIILIWLAGRRGGGEEPETPAA